MSDQAQASPGRRPSWRTATVGAVLVAAAVVATVLVVRSSGPEAKPDKPAEVKPDKPVIVSLEELRSFAAEKGPPVYWAGELRGSRLELTETGRGETYVRYLPAGVRAGDKRPLFTTVGTYPMRRAYAATLAKAKRQGGEPRNAPGGGQAITYPQLPKSVYLVYPGRDQLVEIYDRDPERAKELALSDRVHPIR